MPDLILGLHGGANSSSAIGAAGHLLYCIQEERLTGEKGYMGFPYRAVAACLQHVDAKPGEVTAIAYGSRFGSVDHCPPDKFLLRLRQVHRPGATHAEAHMAEQRCDGMQQKISGILANLGFTASVTFYDHHTAHGAAAYYGLRANPTTPYLVLTCDGLGDGACATIATWVQGQRVEIARTGLRDSVGLLYFWTTYGHGFTPHEDEHKLMGMAPYASSHRAAEVATIFRRYLWLDDTGLRFRRSTRASVEQVWPCIETELRGRRFDDVFGGLQMFTEHLLTAWVSAAVAHTGIRRLLAGGGVFMNVKANQHIAALPDVDEFAAFPSCGDESLALGAYYLTAADQYDHTAVAPLTDCYLGDDITEEEAAFALSGSGYEYTQPPDIHEAVADLLAAGQIVARCAGRMEYGARALGNRSILADPRDADLPRVLNRLIKRRDFWMPFAPVMLTSRHADYLHNPKQLVSPFMMQAFDTAPGAAPDLIAAVHPADLTCRPQLAPDSIDNGIRRVLTPYAQRTGQAVLLNTSLNLHGKPIARTAADALDVFTQSDLCHMQLGPYLVHKV